MSAVITGVPNWLLAGNSIAEFKGFRGTRFVDKVMDGIYEYHYKNKLFISMGSVDCDIVEDLQFS